MKLIQLLYLADREALLRWERPITTDRWVAMKHGPVVSRVYSLICEEPVPGEESFWRRHIQNTRDGQYEVELTEAAGDDELSVAEEKLLRQVFALYGAKSRWEIRDLTHTLPGWRDPEESSTPIEAEAILRGAGRPEKVIAEVRAELENLALLRQM